MVDSESSDIDIDLLMLEIREEISTRMARATATHQVTFSDPSSRSINTRRVSTNGWTLPRLAETSGMLPNKQAYALTEFLVFHDEDFIRNVYRGILGREPDPEGGSSFLAKLRNGNLERVEILGRIRFSPEGRAGGVPVRGLFVAFSLCALRRVPVVGHALALVQHLLELPRMTRERERLEGALFRQQAEMRRGINAIVAAIEPTLQRIRAIETGKADRATLDAIVADLHATLAALQRDNAD